MTFLVGIVLPLAGSAALVAFLYWLGTRAIDRTSGGRSEHSDFDGE